MNITFKHIILFIVSFTTILIFFNIGNGIKPDNYKPKVSAFNLAKIDTKNYIKKLYLELKNLITNCEEYNSYYYECVITGNYNDNVRSTILIDYRVKRRESKITNIF